MFDDWKLKPDQRGDQPSEAISDIVDQSVSIHGRGAWMTPEDDLLAIAAHHRTQKLSHPHYMPLYAKYFAAGREQVRAVLELGVSDGASLRMWEEWFSNAVILGVDNQSETVHAVRPGSETMSFNTRFSADFKRRSTHFLLADQADQDVGKWAARYAPFDLIIDDASHDPTKQLRSLHMLFPHVRPCGCYVIEDLEYSYAEEEIGVEQCSYCGQGGLGMAETVMAMIHDINGIYIDKEMGRSHFEKPRLPGLASVHFYPNIIFLWKEA